MALIIPSLLIAFLFKSYLKLTVWRNHWTARKTSSSRVASGDVELQLTFTSCVSENLTALLVFWEFRALGIQSLFISSRFVFDPKRPVWLEMNAWSLLLGLVLIFCGICVACRDNSQCVNGICCSGYCFWDVQCPRLCSEDADCSGGEECIDSLCGRPTQPTKTTFYSLTDIVSTEKPYTPPYVSNSYNNKNNQNCVSDGNCVGSEACQEGKCVLVDNLESTGKRKGNRGLIITIIVFGVVATIISILYFLRERKVKRQLLLPRGGRRVVNTEGAKTNGASHRAEINTATAACNSAAVIEIEGITATQQPLFPPSCSLRDIRRT